MDKCLSGGLRQFDLSTIENEESDSDQEQEEADGGGGPAKKRRKAKATAKANTKTKKKKKRKGRYAKSNRGYYSSSEEEDEEEESVDNPDAVAEEGKSRTYIKKLIFHIVLNLHEYVSIELSTQR